MLARRRRVVARRWPVVALATAAAAFAYAVHVAVRGTDTVTAGAPLALAALLALGLGGLVLAVRLLVPRALSATTGACLAVSVALLAALPVDFGYDDGCNDHGTVSPLALVPVLAVTHPDRARGSYEDFSTMMACFSGDDRPPPLSQ